MIENIKERLRAAEYATQCAGGHGAFGTTESRMIATFLEHALLDMRYLMDRYTEMEERAEKAERDRDAAWAAADAATARAERQQGLTFAAQRERDEARAERDARPSITPEDARLFSRTSRVVSQSIEDLVPGYADAMDRIAAALRTHAARKGVPHG